MRGLLLAALLSLPCGRALAQPAPVPPAHDSDDALLNAASKRRRSAQDAPAPVAQALSLAFGATFFTQVQVSTSGAVVDLSRLSHEGFYKLELIQLLLLSARSHVPLAQLAEKRRKGEALRDLAFKNGVDYDKLYDSSLAVQEIVDRDYLPRFPQRRPRKERDEP